MSKGFSFIAGSLSLGLGLSLMHDDQNKLEKQNKKYFKNKYNYIYQHDYDYNSKKIYTNYNIDLIMNNFKKDFPALSDSCILQLSKMAAAKRMMEEETDYKYHVPDQIKDLNIDLDKYVTDECKIGET